jgi:hypothetical protein
MGGEARTVCSLVMPKVMRKLAQGRGSGSGPSVVRPVTAMFLSELLEALGTPGHGAQDAPRYGY